MITICDILKGNMLNNSRLTFLNVKCIKIICRYITVIYIGNSKVININTSNRSFINIRI